MSSSIHPEFIQSIAESLGIETTKEAQRCLSLDLEYKIRDIIQVRVGMRSPAFEGAPYVIHRIAHSARFFHVPAVCAQGGTEIPAVYYQRR